MRPRDWIFMRMLSHGLPSGTRSRHAPRAVRQHAYCFAASLADGTRRVPATLVFRSRLRTAGAAGFAYEPEYFDAMVRG